jgi:hypothetical protein
MRDLLIIMGLIVLLAIIGLAYPWSSTKPRDRNPGQ